MYKYLERIKQRNHHEKLQVSEVFLKNVEGSFDSYKRITKEAVDARRAFYEEFGTSTNHIIK